MMNEPERPAVEPVQGPTPPGISTDRWRMLLAAGRHADAVANRGADQLLRRRGATVAHRRPVKLEPPPRAQVEPPVHVIVRRGPGRPYDWAAPRVRGMTTAADRLAAKLIKPKGADGCWIWTGRTERGYGRLVGTEGTQVMAHVLAYQLAVGPVPPGLELDHTCNNRACCNPSHLEPVTRAENARRGWARLSPERRAERIERTTSKATAAASARSGRTSR